MTAAKQVYEWVKTGHWSLSEFKEWAEQAKPVAQYSDIISDGGLDPRNQFDAPLQRQPLTRERVKELTAEAGYDTATMQERADFINGIRHAENAHGITGDRNESD